MSLYRLTSIRHFLFIASIFITTYATAQTTAKEYYKQAGEKVDDGEYEAAIELLNKVIDLEPENPYAWYNRGIVNGYLDLHEYALVDFERAIALLPDYPKAYLNRGTTKKHLTDYEGAIDDYNYVISIDSENTYAYYNRGLLYHKLGRIEEACNDYNTALNKGMEAAKRRVDFCKDPIDFGNEKNPILRLSKVAKTSKYGFDPDMPILVGTGYISGPQNQQDYLNLLRDPQGKPVKYHRTRSCCAYKSKNAMLGNMALVDEYEITYLDEQGNTQSKLVYLSFYDYKEPKILYGFTTVKPPENK